MTAWNITYQSSILDYNCHCIYTRSVGMESYTVVLFMLLICYFEENHIKNCAIHIMFFVWYLTILHVNRIAKLRTA